MLYLSHETSSDEFQPTPLNDLEQLLVEQQEEHERLNPPPPPPPPKKPAYDYRVPQAAKCETSFRHSYWQARREKIRDCLESAGQSKFAIDRFAQCGSGCVVEMTRNGEKIRLKACYCHSKHCEPCMRAKANKITANLRSRLEENPSEEYRFVTLTLKHTHKPLAEQIQKLYGSWRKMRGYKEWKNTQWGGAAMLEVKYDEKTGMWHPHLHIISEGIFLHKRDLSEMWKQATGDSYITDIRAMKDRKEVAHYVCKYITKGTSPTVWNIPSVAQEWIIASKGVRTMATYGTWRGFRLLQVTPDGEEWKPVTTLIKLYEAIERGEDWAMIMLKRLDERKLSAEKHKPPDLGLFPN
jgi:hypothetical protein